MTLNYNAGTGGNPSSIDNKDSNEQLQSFLWLRKSLIEARKEQYFTPLASSTDMPKHYGKTIKLLEYVPLLDDRNINDQGIDAAGATLVPGTWSAFLANGTKKTDGVDADANGSYPTKAAAVTAAGAGGQVVSNGGALYGSSKDIGTINARMPLVGEEGGRVNRVGFTRIQREGTFEQFGLFYEFTRDSLDFDSDSELKGHLARELVNGAVQLTEAVLQKDLLAAAGTVLYAGTGTTDATMTGESTATVPSEVTFEDLTRLSQMLTDNRTPKQTKVITGSRLVDTKTIPGARVMFIGSELLPLLRKMKDTHGNPAFIAVQHYADAGNVLNGEVGTIDEFRIVVVPEMLHWAGKGATETVDNEGYRATNGKYDIFPMFVVGEDAFTTIGYQTDGKSSKFAAITKMPGEKTADHNDPFGLKGFSSLRWHYGILVKRSERLGLIKTLAPI